MGSLCLTVQGSPSSYQSLVVLDVALASASQGVVLFFFFFFFRAPYDFLRDVYLISATGKDYRRNKNNFFENGGIYEFRGMLHLSHPSSDLIDIRSLIHRGRKNIGLIHLLL
jgi:hypothetical protein